MIEGIIPLVSYKQQLIKHNRNSKEYSQKGTLQGDVDIAIVFVWLKSDCRLKQM